jgi:hypothetical protein
LGRRVAEALAERRLLAEILLTTGSVVPPAGMGDGEFPLLLKPYSVDSPARALSEAFGTGVLPMAATPVG